MCNGQKGSRGEEGAGGLGAACLLPPPSPGPELWRWRCCFPREGPPNPGPSKQHQGLCWGVYGGQVVPPSAGAAGLPVLVLLGSRGGSWWSEGLPGTALFPTGRCWRTDLQPHSHCPGRGGPRGRSPALPNTPKHLHLVYPQRGVLGKRPRPAPIPKERADGHGRGRTEEDRAGRESGGTAGQASGRAGEGRGRRGVQRWCPAGGLRGR